MLSDDAVEDGACLARNSLFIHSGLEDMQIILIGKHARRQIQTNYIDISYIAIPFAIFKHPTTSFERKPASHNTRLDGGSSLFNKRYRTFPLTKVVL